MPLNNLVDAKALLLHRSAARSAAAVGMAPCRAGETGPLACIAIRSLGLHLRLLLVALCVRAYDASDMAEGGVVWILGAGFSKSLGAPLLGEMLTHEALATVLETYPDLQADRGRYNRVVRSYLSGAVALPNNPAVHRRNLWRHAEEYAERLDLASRDTVAALILRRVLSELERKEPGYIRNEITPENAAAWVRETLTYTLRLMAAECAAFTEFANIDSERWKPYMRWAMSLQPQDTVLTFNYDRVPNILADKTSLLDVVTPNQLDGVAKRARVCKLHGSVDWSRREEAIGSGIPPGVWCPPLGMHRLATYLDPGTIGIATPGPSKYSLVRRELRPLWDHAARAIQNARAVVLVGYSMPPSDAYSRTWLLDQLRLNFSGVTAHTVLGSNVGSPESARLMGLLKSIERVRSVVQHPMWAEDFLDAFERRALSASFGS